MQNFKMSASEYLRCAPKYTISRLNNQKFSGEGAQPLPQTPPRRGWGHPLSAPYPPQHLRRLASRAFGARPPTQKSWLRPRILQCNIIHLIFIKDSNHIYLYLLDGSNWYKNFELRRPKDLWPFDSTWGQGGTSVMGFPLPISACYALPFST